MVLKSHDVDFTEASVAVEGHELNFAESLVLRVALETFVMQLQENGLGDDAKGRALAANYIRNGLAVLKHIANAKELN